MTVSSRGDYDDENVSTDRQTAAEEDEEVKSEELGSQETYIYPTKFGFCRDYDNEEGEAEPDKPIVLKRIAIADPEPMITGTILITKTPIPIPGPPQYLTRLQAQEIPKIEVTGDADGESEPKKSRRGSRVSFPIPDPVSYMHRDEKLDVLQVEIHQEPSGADVVDSKRKTSRVTFNIPDPVQYIERPEVYLKKKFEESSEDEISDREDQSGGRTSDSEVEEVTERKRFRPVTARTRVTSPLPEPVNYLSRRESELSSLGDAIQAARDSLDQVEEQSDKIVAKSDAASLQVKPKEPYKIPEPVTYLTREEKLARLQTIANSGSVDSDTKVFNEIMRAVEASQVNLDSDDVYHEIVKAFSGPQYSIDSNEVYNEIMAALKFDERDEILASARVGSVDLSAPEILSFQDFISSSTYSTTKQSESPPLFKEESLARKVEKLEEIDQDESSAKDTETEMKITDSLDIPENPVPSPVHYPSSKVRFDESPFTPIMVDGKIRKVSARSLSQLRQHCSSRAHPCDCNDVGKRSIFF